MPHRGRDRLALGDEDEDEQERDGVGRGIHVQDVGRADERDEQACDGRADQRCERRTALDDAVPLRHQPLVLAHELREDRPLRGEVRRHEAAEERDEHEQQPEVEHPAACSSGIDASSGARAKSATSIVERAPMRWTRSPLGIPSSAMGAISAARTSVIFAGEPVVTSTNHGSARYVIRVPSTEITSARTRAPTAFFAGQERALTGE